jgi:aminoglycoside phosphotransferase (APT) family kinase protein
MNMTEQEIVRRLLEYLREATERPSLAYSDAPTSLTGGFENSVFGFRLSGAPQALSGPLVLRLFAEFDSSERARLEATVHNAVAELGYLAPRVLVTETRKEALGRTFLIMERLRGRTLAAEFEGLGQGRSFGELVRLLMRAPNLVREISQTMATAQVCLHRLPAEPLMRAMESGGLPLRAITLEGRLERLTVQAEQTGFAGLRDGAGWLAKHRPAQTTPLAVCHCDFQPFNIMRAEGRITGILDWEKVTLAAPEMDVGSTIGNLLTVPLQVPGALYGIFQFFMKALTRFYYRAYCQLQTLDDRAVRYHQAFRSMRELAWVVEGIIHERANLGVYGSARGIKNLVSHIRSLTGVSLNVDISALRAYDGSNP